MKFKHTFHVFVDNFSVTYKQLLYRLVISLIAMLICWFGVFRYVRNVFINSEAFNSLWTGIQDFVKNLLYGKVDELGNIHDKINTAYNELVSLMNTHVTQIVLCALLLVLVYIVEKWFAGLGNYATAAVINDKMALRGNSPFLVTLIRNLKEAAIYNAIYVPLSLIYDAVVVVALFFLLFTLVNSFLPLVFCIFLFVLCIVLSSAVKMTFTADWLPALIRGKLSQGAAIKYTFSRKNKQTWNVFSNFVVVLLILFSMNVAALITTVGVGLLITIPSSYVILVSFELINYYDREEMRYFVDKNTIIKPSREHTPTREEFFRGEDD